MAVASTVQLPAQPTTGLTETIPLGGNGFSAPHSIVAVELELANDASGGLSSLVINMDPRYTSLVSYITHTTTSAAADPHRCQIAVFNTDCDLWADQPDTVVFNGSAVGAAKPPGMLLKVVPGQTPRITATWVNVDTETNIVNCRIYQFDRQMIHTVPVWLAMQNLPR